MSVFIFKLIRKGFHLKETVLYALGLIIFGTIYYNYDLRSTESPIVTFRVIDYEYYEDNIGYKIESDNKNFIMYVEKGERIPIGSVCRTLTKVDVVNAEIERNFIKRNEIRKNLSKNLSGKIYLEDLSEITCYRYKHTFITKLNEMRFNYIVKVKASSEHSYIGDMLMLSIGSKIFLTNELFYALQKLGIYHLYVISGTHVAYLSVAIFVILKMFRIPIEIIKMITIIMLILFLLINVFNPSVFRAVFMSTLLIISSFLKKKPYVAVISISALVQLGFSPFIIYNAGFALSYLTTFTILLCRKNISNMHSILQLFLITLIAEFSTLLIILVFFNEISLSGLLMNLIFDPLFTLIIFPATLIFNVALFTIFPVTLDSILNIIFSYNHKFILFLSTVIEHRVVIKNFNAYITILIILLTYFIIKTVARKKFKQLVVHIVLLLTVIITFANYSKNDFKVTMIDVGQGDSLLIQDLKNDVAILIDTGGRYYREAPRVRLSDKTVLPYLKEQGIRKIDLLVLTHFDNDHIGEFSHIYENIDVNRIMINLNDDKLDFFLESYQGEHSKLIHSDHLSQFNIGNIRIRNLTIKEQFTKESNANSIILDVSLNKFSFLFLGDARIEEEKKIIPILNTFDVLKVGHHGSDTSTSEELVQLSFNYALVSAGVNNRYKHPHNVVIERLTQNDKFILNTKDDGMIEMIIKRNKMCIRSKLSKQKDHCVKKE
ncbi:DNA internalization-related competence protein ComEC/Rec2 [Phocicoccus pinnipedialis]|uniref:DNA internalization-related competence protein ComEC/Rec2 n=1 Tax=Phocicoccus pinnipedialis TaxID=110845 RepID=UPI001AE8B121|nr:DNA internalization-related competence protein ComEC/Rec2 [Jeotgalicoccus pinnipedialis]MBP1939245.1 competence protein ComEC [Jeotgalicoccus pinnipedialis]